MSDDMRLLILTHLRTAMERKDWRQVARAERVLYRSSALISTQAGLATAYFRQSWPLVEAVYVALGGMGSGEPGKSPGDPSAARDGAYEGAAA